MPVIVHLGLGNFHRAHQAWYTQSLPDWTITAVAMSNRDLRDAMIKHGNHYLLGIWGSKGLEVKTIETITRTLLATEQMTDVVEAIGDPETQVITLTITEKGYHLRAGGGGLDTEAPGIAEDLTRPMPKTALGLLAAGLSARAAAGAGPVSVISCDNLSDNGRRLERALRDFMGLKAPELLDWVRSNVTFPNTMVDRITPRLSEEAVNVIRDTAGATGMPVVGTEDFSEWIIEDAFASSRPAWDEAGARFVADIGFYEKRKLRLLNAAHSFLAYAGLLRGHTFIHEAMGDAELQTGVNALWDEAETAFRPDERGPLAAYRHALELRFSVPEMQHRLEQIAVDGSFKLVERVSPTIHARKANDLPAPQAETVIRSWIDFVLDRILTDNPLNDGREQDIRKIVREAGTAERARRMLSNLVVPSA